MFYTNIYKTYTMKSINVLESYVELCRISGTEILISLDSIVKIISKLF